MAREKGEGEGEGGEGKKKKKNTFMLSYKLDGVGYCMEVVAATEEEAKEQLRGFLKEHYQESEREVL